MNLHGPNRHHPLGIEVAPGAYAVEELNIGRADGINARIPALRATGGWLSTKAIRNRVLRSANARLAPARPPPTMIRSNCCISAIMPVRETETNRQA
jgi:hypothetical protein